MTPERLNEIRAAIGDIEAALDEFRRHDYEGEFRDGGGVFCPPPGMASLILSEATHRFHADFEDRLEDALYELQKMIEE